jgi:hypothetical protein
MVGFLDYCGSIASLTEPNASVWFGDLSGKSDALYAIVSKDCGCEDRVNPFKVKPVLNALLF